ncbi:MAG: hypothetical protein ACLGGV_02835 [Bacteroidia bacterium]
MGDGTVWTTSVKIRTKDKFPDYVFEPNYKLMPLYDVEAYIKEHKHLPNIPTAKEVAEEGLNVEQLQIKQMEKN